MSNAKARLVFNRLNKLYDELEETHCGDTFVHMSDVDYPREQIHNIDKKIRQLMEELEYVLPGLEMEARGEY